MIAELPAGFDWLAGWIDPSWPLGLISAVLAALLLWPVGARLGLSPASRATAAACYATAAVLVEVYDPAGTDGRATMLLAAAAWLAVGSRLRNALRAAADRGRGGPGPGDRGRVPGAARGDGRGRRAGHPAPGRGSAGCWPPAAWAAAVARGRRAAAPRAAAGAAAAGARACSACGRCWWSALLWRRMRWLRPLGVALLGLLACCWLPGPDADAVVVLAAVGGLLTAVLAEEYPGLLVRRGVAVGLTGLGLAGGAARAGRHPPRRSTRRRPTPPRWPRPPPAAAARPAPAAGRSCRCVRWRSPSRPWASPGRWRT